MDTTRLSSKGQLVLPKAIREADAWTEGTEFIVERVEDARGLPTVDQSAGLEGGKLSEQAVAAALTTAPTTDIVPAAPAARRLAKELGVDLTKISGSGPGGRITVESQVGAGTTFRIVLPVRASGSAGAAPPS